MIKSLLDDIDAGNSNMTEDEMEETNVCCDNKTCSISARLWQSGTICII